MEPRPRMSPAAAGVRHGEAPGADIEPLPAIDSVSASTYKEGAAAGNSIYLGGMTWRSRS